MQVRKFEAGSMQEALKLVKVELGPDAIILSAKDNSSGYGLLHQSSVEITAAIPERHLQKKKFFESRLREADKIRFKEAPAKLQKKLIENSVSKYVAAEGRSSTTSERPRYAMIADEEPGGELSAASAAPEKPAPAVPQSAQTRIRSAVRAAGQRHPGFPWARSVPLEPCGRSPPR